jgi:hypothetical protein
VQSVVARVNFSHEGTLGLISNSRGTVEKAIVVLLQATCKITSLSPTPPSGCQAQGINVSKIKYDNANKVNNNTITYDA